MTPGFDKVYEVDLAGIKHVLLDMTADICKVKFRRMKDMTIRLGVNSCDWVLGGVNVDPFLAQITGNFC